jgi:nitrous oxidase accessory protein NosD
MQRESVVKTRRVSTAATAALAVIAAVIYSLGDRMRLALQQRSEVELVVSNKADAGPATLRDAILAADRSSQRARIVVAVSPIHLDSALPPLANPRGVSLECRSFNAVAADKKTDQPAPCVLEPAADVLGSVLRIDSPRSVVRGFAVKSAKERAVTVTAESVELDDLTVADCKDGILVGTGGAGLILRRGRLEHNDTAIRLEGDVRRVRLEHNTLQDNRTAAFWFVGAAGSTDSGEAAASLTDNAFLRNGNGLVIGNEPMLIEHNRFVDTKQIALLVLGGSATIRGNDIRNSGSIGISINGGRDVAILDNEIGDAPGIAIMLRSSSGLVERNTLHSNAYGIVSLLSTSSTLVIEGNLIFSNSADGLTVIGGSPQLNRNRIMRNRLAGLRVFDLVEPSARHPGRPTLNGNVLEANGLDTPAVAVYRLDSTLPR